jgi:tetratricopeptide (TPR) repeat protein
VDSGGLDVRDVLVQDLFTAAAEQAERDPSADMELTDVARQCEENGDWSGAESAYTTILALPDADAPDVVACVRWKAHSDLYRLCRWLNRHDDAFRHAVYATAAARQSDTSMLVVFSLCCEAGCYMRRGELDAAEKAIAEALSCLDDETMFDQARARIVTLRAEWALRHGRYDAAAEDLDRSFEILNRMSNMELAAGVHGDLANWWKTTARLRAVRGDLSGAAAAWEEAVSRDRHVASLPHTADVHARLVVAETLRGLADALDSEGRSEEASEARRERLSILDLANVPAA